MRPGTTSDRAALGRCKGSTTESRQSWLDHSQALAAAKYAPHMQVKRGALEQHIAVFGESGSGKTVMVSSFYGATQEPQFLKSSLFDVTADDAGQGHRLHANYLGMKDSGRRPETTRFSATPYAFLSEAEVQD